MLSSMGKGLLIFLIVLLVVGISSFIYLYPDEAKTQTGKSIEVIDKGIEKTQEAVEDLQENIKQEENQEQESENEEEDNDEEIEENQDEESEPEPEPQTKIIRIANFNAQIFGDSKWESLGAEFYIPLIEDYDIFFLQEIRDKDGSSFNSLCNELEGYQCDISSRAGRSSSKEQYGIIYKEGITATLTDYNPDQEDRWERPPIEVKFDIDDYNLIVWNIHTKPDDVENEINHLEETVIDEGNVIVLGDLNLDCDYNDGSSGDFEGWNYLIGDNDDTTTKQTNCAYDRIILNDGAYGKFEDYGIDTSITEDESDHYLIWVEIEI